MTELSGENKKGFLTQVQHYWHIILKWKWSFIIFFFTVMVATTTFSFLVRPIYQAKGSVWIENEPKILPFDEIQPLDAGTNVQSYSHLLKSRALAAGTIEKLKLYENPDFAGNRQKRRNPVNSSDPVFRERLIEDLLNNISVTPVERTQLLDVQFSSRNPKLASDVLNALFDGYIDMIVQKKFSTFEEATKFLNIQIASLRSEIQEAENRLNKYGSEKDILPLTAAEAPTVTRLAEVNKALTAATIEKINKLNYYNQIKSAPLGELPEVPNDGLLQRLREQYLTLNREYSKRLTTVRPEYPEMQRSKSEVDAAREALQAETQNAVRKAYADYQAALEKEQSLRQLLNNQKNEAYSANSNSVIYNSLRIELDNKKTLLEALSKRQSETDVSSRLKGLEALNVWIVDRASLPLRPAFPNRRKNVLIGLLLGLGGGIGLALFIEFLNNTVKTSRDITTSTGLPTLGVIPTFEFEASPKGPQAEFSRLINILWGKSKAPDSLPPRREGDISIRVANSSRANQPEDESNRSKIELIASREPNSIQAESYRSIRTTLLVSSPPGKIKSILVTSPLAREGKTATVANLGITLSQAGKRVVIVDADLRKPKQNRIFGINSGWGLTHFVSSFIDAPDLVRPTQFPNLFLITSGPIPASPIDLLTSEKMDQLIAFLKRSFDYILFDTPPILAVSDALAIGPMIDGIILVARGGQTPLPALKQAKEKIDALKIKCLGVILNGVNLVEQDGYYAKQYYQYSKPE
jgi:succinoglycan biosynthesis transport protein ExoP